MNGQTPGPVPFADENGMHVVEQTLTRVRAAPDLPGLLTEAFDAFEVIRILARGGEERYPELLAAFMTAADAAIDGREALTVASSLPAGPGRMAADAVSSGTAGPGAVADLLGRLGMLLAGRLTGAARAAALPGDEAACLKAAEAAQRISQLMAREGDDRDLR